MAVLCSAELTSSEPAARWTASPGVAGRPLPDEGGSASRVGGRRLPPQLLPIKEGFIHHGRQIVTPHTGLLHRLLKMG